MAEPSKVTPMMPKLNIAEAFLSGLIASRRKITTTNGALWLTLLKLPAQDEYSHPSTVEIRSRSPIGNLDDKWSGVVKLSGFPRSYNSTDQETGEVSNVKTAQNIFDVIDA